MPNEARFRTLQTVCGVTWYCKESDKWLNYIKTELLSSCIHLSLTKNWTKNRVTRSRIKTPR